MKKMYYNHYMGIFGETPEAVAKALAKRKDRFGREGTLMGLIKRGRHYRVAICLGGGEVRGYVIDVAEAV